MASEVTYIHPNEQPIKVAFPSGDGCPFIPQSNYAFGERARVTVCADINGAVHNAYCVLVGASPRTYPGAGMHAHEVACNLMDELMTGIGYKRTTSEQI